jgi:hypothetical protein
MNVFIDTEFIENGHTKPLRLISIGLVREDGSEYYAQAGTPEELQADLKEAASEDWLNQNVVPHLDPGAWRTRNQIANDIINFVGVTKNPSFWGWFCQYDWVLFCQLFGSMINMPPGFPHLCFDLKQELYRLGVRGKPQIPMRGVLHNALADARWVYDVHTQLIGNARYK